MSQILHIDASPRGERSHSRRLSKEFVAAWTQKRPQDALTYRDVGHNPPPHVDEAWIAAAFAAPADLTPELLAAIKISDELVDELLAADVIVLGVPMYNFGMPSGLKAYIDQIVRFGRTVDFTPEDKDAPYKPRLHNKRLFVFTARGDAGYGEGESNAGRNHLDPHLVTAFGYIGISDITFVHVENDEFGGQSLADSIAAAQLRITELIESETVEAVAVSVAG